MALWDSRCCADKIGGQSPNLVAVGASELREILLPTGCQRLPVFTVAVMVHGIDGTLYKDGTPESQSKC